MKLKIVLFLGTVFFTFAMLGQSEVEAATGTIPPWPLIYTANVTLAGAPAPDGLLVVGKIRDYTSIPVAVEAGRIVGLAVGPPDYSYFGETITFELLRGEETVVANETDTFTNLVTPTLRKDFQLTFPGFPTPTPLPTATATATPLATSTPLATATPISVGPIVYNGMVVVSGGTVPEGATLTARIGGYESAAVSVVDGQFISLIIDLDDPSMTDKEVTFYLNGVLSRTTAIYSVGATIRNVDLIFMEIPGSNVSAPLVAPVMPTQVPIETSTPEPTVAPIAAPVVAATVAPIAAPKETPTPIVLVVTATPEVPPVTLEGEEPKEGSGGCMSVGDIDPLTGTANVLAMVGPLLLLVGYRGFRRMF